MRVQKKRVLEYLSKPSDASLKDTAYGIILNAGKIFFIPVMDNLSSITVGIQGDDSFR